ncbi:MAG: DUF3048 domain-containing protein [Acidimicrobiia bacterium]
MLRRTPVLIALVLVAACSSPATTTTTAPTTTVATTTTTRAATTTTSSSSTATTTTPPVGYSNLNGMPVYDEDLLDRRVLMVKIDNSLPAQPQSGIEIADAMTEILVEDRTTRFIALFHYSDSEYVGPIRSLRPADLQIATALSATMVNTGAQPWITSMAFARNIPRVTFFDSIMYRIDERNLPHNVYGSTLGFRDFADDRGFPDVGPTPWLPFGEWPLPPEPAMSVTLTWVQGFNEVEWRFNSATQRYERWVRGDYQEWVDEEGEGGRIDADVLVVIAARSYIAHPPSGVEGSAVPAVDSVGSGKAWVFSRGRVWEGTWQRDNEREPFQLFDESGHAATVPPGKLWVSLLPNELVEYE